MHLQFTTGGRQAIFNHMCLFVELGGGGIDYCFFYHFQLAESKLPTAKHLAQMTPKENQWLI